MHSGNISALLDDDRCEEVSVLEDEGSGRGDREGDGGKEREDVDEGIDDAEWDESDDGERSERLTRCMDGDDDEDSIEDADKEDTEDDADEGSIDDEMVSTTRGSRGSLKREDEGNSASTSAPLHEQMTITIQEMFDTETQISIYCLHV